MSVAAPYGYDMVTGQPIWVKPSTIAAPRVAVIRYPATTPKPTMREQKPKSTAKMTTVKQLDHAIKLKKDELSRLGQQRETLLRKRNKQPHSSTKR